MRKNTSLLAFSGKCLLLLVLLFALDRTIGMGLEKLFFMQKHGDDAVSTYLFEKANEDIIIMGASRASHHFNSELLEKATGMTCYNGGRDNMPIQYAASTLPFVYQRNSPKVLILDIIPTELWISQNTYEKLAKVLLPYYHRYPEVLNTIRMKDKQESLKVKLSYIYPYNSTVGTSFQNAFTHLGHASIKGYEPLSGTIDSTTYKEPVWGNFTAGQKSLDTNSINAFIKVIKLAKSHHTRLIGIISPFYFPVDFKGTNSFIAIKKMLEDNGCELYDFSHDPRFLQHPEMFKDDLHLNDSGATLFDQTIIDILHKNKVAVAIK